MEYNPLRYIQKEISDDYLIQIILHGGIKKFCYALTLDLYTQNIQEKLG